MVFDSEYLDFVSKHRTDDPVKLRLRYHADPRSWIPMAINNIAALKKSRKFKLSPDCDLTPRVIPLEVSAQQSTSAPVALLHANLAGNAMSVLDMTFGLGMDAALLCRTPQRHILGFDLREELVSAAQVNFADNAEVEVRQGDSVEFLRNYSGEPFDLIFIDPARRGEEGQRLYNLHDCQPDLTELLPLFGATARRVMAKLSPMLDITQTIRDLRGITGLHIVEENGECKELLAIITPGSHIDSPDDTPLVIDRLTKNGLSQFSFTRREEKSASPKILSRIPRPGEYLYDPSAATMKAAPFNLLSAGSEISALHPNTHLYVGSLTENFPGTRYQITDAMPLTSANLKKLARDIDKADISTRNLKGFTPEILRKRLKIKPGDDIKIYAATAALPDGDAPLIIIGKRE